jgi:ATP-binding cassette subfamily F protein 3
MLIVTHDRYLANRIADRIIIMDEDGMREFEGDWDAYKEFLAESTAPKEKEAPAVKNDYQLSKERKSALAKAKAAQRKAEERVHVEETALKSLEEKAFDPQIASDFEAAKSIYEQLDVQRQLVETCYYEWDRRRRSCKRSKARSRITRSGFVSLEEDIRLWNTPSFLSVFALR